jgi:hypothetical protein
VTEGVTSPEVVNLEPVNLELAELKRRAWALPAGEEQLEVLETAVRLADSLGDLAEGFTLRHQLMDAANAWGRPETELVAFVWCLAQYDRDPKTFSHFQFRLMWTYKRILACLGDFPQISSSRIEAAFSDFRARLERSGASLSTYHEFWLRYTMQHGHRTEAAAAALALSKRRGTAALSCQACELQREVEYRIFVGDDAGAVKLAQKLLGPRAPDCNRVPHSTHATLLLPLLRLGQLEQAALHHQQYRKISRDRGSARPIALHLEYLGYLGDVKAGTRLLERHLGWAYRSHDLRDRSELLRATLPLVWRLQASGRATVKLKLGSSVPFEREDQAYSPGELMLRLRAEVQQLADSFDARNGNSHFSSRIGPDVALLERLSAPVAPG